MKKLSGWGRFPVACCNVARPVNEKELLETLAGSDQQVIARGQGRAYGDSALCSALTIDMTGFSRMLSFDPDAGVLVTEAGVVLADIIETFLPRGWFPAVTPGTKFVSVGGMIAADVHGKNHHCHGSFGNFVEWIDLLGPQDIVVRCSRQQNVELFRNTIGGMGLTGIVLRAAIRLTRVESGWIRQRSVALSDLDAALEAFDQAHEATYSVAWIDCLAQGRNLGRSILLLGEHARLDELSAGQAERPFNIPARRQRAIPANAPSWLLNKYSVRAFNELYYRFGKAKSGPLIIDWDSYFYPLDAIVNWNRIYGRRGFMQFQCVIPLEAARSGVASLLEATSIAGSGSFLAVLKRLGVQESAFSFPMDGYTLALDFPVSSSSLQLLERLDAITLAHDGRFYLAKDARMSKETLEASDARVSAFRKFRLESQAWSRFGSAQSRRLGI